MRKSPVRTWFCDSRRTQRSRKR